LLVSVGHLSPRKGFHHLLRVLPGLLREFPDLTLVIVGGMEEGGPYEGQLRSLIAELDLLSKAVLAGPQPPEVVARWLNAADVFVLASAREGCPNVVWEAMACGRPVVVTRVGEVEHMVPGHAGILCDRAEDEAGLARALAEALRRPWDQEAIRAHAAAHTWEAVAGRVVGVWREALGPAGRALEPGRRVAGLTPAGVNGAARPKTGGMNPPARQRG
jgi:glycosyltransferase involved in cell wall biosynthesis